jgi:hypothetical protein
MFFKKKTDEKVSKLPGPRDLPEAVKKTMSANDSIDPDSIQFLKAVVKYGEDGSKVCDIRIFDPSDAEARNIRVKDYNTLTENPDMIICEGKYDETDRKAEITIKKEIPKIKLLTSQEILEQIEALKEPGSSIFFYMSAGPAAGGPLGRGSAIVKLNANGDKKGKKYSIYGANIINMKPDKEGVKIFDSDKSKDVAKWITESQKPRFV